jgi:hypothetical protein
MKTPRVTDFDPDAKPPALKSPLDSMPVIQRPLAKKIPDSSPASKDAPKQATTPLLPTTGDKTRTPSTPVPLVRVVRDVPLVPRTPPAKRVMKQRHPFDIYQDQYEALQQLALEERKQGGVGSMSAMVREGIDLIIAKKRGEQK